MGYLGVLSVVLTALVLTGNSGNTELPIITQVLLVNIPLFIEYILRIRKAYKELQARKKMLEEITKLGQELEKDDNTKH